MIATAPDGVRLVVVKILTDQDGLYGYGCATFTQRAESGGAGGGKISEAVPIGKPADRIEDTWQACYNSSYWRNGPVLNNAISGVDQALWDIKGRQCGMPVYQLAGRQVPRGRRLLRPRRGRRNPAGRSTPSAVHGEGLPHTCACRSACPAWRPTARGAADVQGRKAPRRAGLRARSLHAPRAQDVRGRAARSSATRSKCCTTSTSASRPTRPFRFCQGGRALPALLPGGPALARGHRITSARSASSAPRRIAMGELFNSPHEWTPLISERLIDYIRVHVTQAGGFTPCAQDRHPGRDVRRQDRLARPGRRFAHRPRRQRHARHGLLQLRHPGVLAVQRSPSRKSSPAARR